MKYITGNLLESKAKALVNAVNTVGVMGKGIALQFKKRFPLNFKLYAAACKKGEVKIGKMFVAQESDLQGRRVFTTAGRRSLRFRADGRNAGTNLTLRVCDATGAPQRLLIVNVGGRARIAPAPVTTAPCPAS